MELVLLFRCGDLTEVRPIKIETNENLLVPGVTLLSWTIVFYVEK